MQSFSHSVSIISGLPGSAPSHLAEGWEGGKSHKGKAGMGVKTLSNLALSPAFAKATAGNACALSPEPLAPYLYSSQLFIARSSISNLQKARIKALARRAFVIRGTLKSTALLLIV